jgi:cytidylate kinase
MKSVIAFDGPAASGKSTIAREISKILNFTNVSSGGFYRAITWLILKSEADPKSPEAVAEVLAKSKLEYDFNDQGAVLFIDGTDPTPFLKDERINQNVSPIAQSPAVRDNVNAGLRTLGNLRDCVIEGRDIGTVVFPDTKFKFYIDASPEVAPSVAKPRAARMKSLSATRWTPPGPLPPWSPPRTLSSSTAPTFRFKKCWAGSSITSARKVWLFRSHDRHLQHLLQPREADRPAGLSAPRRAPGADD